jgi:hypothetical protein
MPERDSLQRFSMDSTILIDVILNRAQYRKRPIFGLRRFEYLLQCFPNPETAAKHDITAEFIDIASMSDIDIRTTDLSAVEMTERIRSNGNHY